MRYTLLVAVIMLSCSSPTGPTTSIPDNGDPPTPHARAIQQTGPTRAEPDTLWIKPGSVRVTNTSGGSMMVFADQENAKPTLIHFDVDEDRTDVAKWNEDGARLTSFTVETERFDHVREGGGGSIGSTGNITTGVLVNEEYARGASGRMRSKTIKVAFEIQSPEDRWVVGNPLSEEIAVDEFSPFPSDLILHPVLPVDSTFAPDSTLRASMMTWADEAVTEYRNGIFPQMVRHSPIYLSEIRVGSAILVDTTDYFFLEVHEDRDYGSRALYSMTGRDCSHEWARQSACPEAPFDNLTTLDFHVALVRRDLPGGKQYAAGAALLGSPYAFVYHMDGNEAGNAEVLLHELGHTLGLGHVESGGEENTPIDHDYPHGPVMGLINVPGYEHTWRGSVQEIDPHTHYDFMSYTNPSWISAYHYRKMAEYRLGIEPTLAATRRVIPDYKLIRCGL